MTTPTERTLSVLRMEMMVHAIEQYIYTGTDSVTVVPVNLLRLIVQTLRHYPTRYDLERSAQALPDVWGEPPRGAE